MTSAVLDLKRFFSHFKKSAPKQKAVYLRVSHMEFVLFTKEGISQTFIIGMTELMVENEKIVQEILDLGFPNGQDSLTFHLQDFDAMVHTVNSIVPNLKDLRLYLEQVNNRLYLTVGVETKQVEHNADGRAKGDEVDGGGVRGGRDTGDGAGREPNTDADVDPELDGEHRKIIGNFAAFKLLLNIELIFSRTDRLDSK